MCSVTDYLQITTSGGLVIEVTAWKVLHTKHGIHHTKFNKNSDYIFDISENDLLLLTEDWLK